MYIGRSSTLYESVTFIFRTVVCTYHNTWNYTLQDQFKINCLQTANSTLVYNKSEVIEHHVHQSFTFG